MISLRSGLCILASTGVSLQKVVPLGIHTNVNTYSAVSYWSCFVFFCRRFWRFFTICFLSPSFVVRCLHLQFVCLFVYFVVRALTHPTCLAQDTGLYLCCQFHAQFRFVLARFKFHFFVLWWHWAGSGREKIATLNETKSARVADNGTPRPQSWTGATMVHWN